MIHAALATSLALTALPFAPPGSEPNGAPPAARSSEAPREAAFEAGWRVVAGYLANQHWDRARERLLPLLEEHAGEPYVLLRRPEIVDALERIGFFRSHRTPDAGDLVAGDLVRWRAHSGHLEVRYKPSQMNDFLVRDGSGGFRMLDASPAPDELVLHPARFIGPCKITVAGDRFAPTSTAPAIVVGWDDDSSLVVHLGYRVRIVDNRRVHATPRIVWNDRGHARTLAEDSLAPIETGDSYEVQVVLDPRTVSVLVDGRELFNASRPRGDYGQLGFLGFPDFSRVTLEGKVEPAWIEGLADSRIQQHWIEFRRSRSAHADLPDWLQLPAARWDLGIQDPSSLRAIDAAAREALGAIQDRIAEDDLAAARALAEELRATGAELPGRIGTLLVESAAGDWNRALEEADAVLGSAPELRYVRRFRAAIELMLHDLEAAREHLEEELARDPLDDWAPARLAKLELLTGDLDAVQRTLREAVEAGRYTPELDDVNRTLTKARNGPPWARVHEYRFGRFVVRSDIDRQACLDASRTLGTALALFEKWLRPLPADRREPFSVYLFSGQWGYLSYGADVLEFAPESTAGVYSPWLQQLLIWNLPERAEMLATVRHEAFHQYLDCLVGVTPIWLNEGMAEVWEAADTKHFNGRDVEVAPEHVSLLRSIEGLVPLEHFLYMDRSEFMANASLHYAQAWALCHMLFEDSRSGRHRLLTLLDRLQAGDTPEEATRAAFHGEDLRRLDARLADYVTRL